MDETPDPHASEGAILRHLIAADDLLKALGREARLTPSRGRALKALRDAHSFLYEAALRIATGYPLDDAETVDRYVWAVMRLGEFNEALPMRQHRVAQRKLQHRVRVAYNRRVVP